ncbi:MAG: hypothetical protein IBJ12_12275 [Sphingomonadaceae bacterium]|nr:hypothetical protein [Sphingomonadaceae bacterium]
MKTVFLILAATLALAACVEEPSPKNAENAAEDIQKNVQQDLVADRKRSIEEAAEEATKLIEADAKAEVDEVIASNPAN